MEFKDRVFQARKAKGMSQEDLAEAMGVSRQAVSKWETGEAMPDVEKLIALCHVLELDMEYLALGKKKEATEEKPLEEAPAADPKKQKKKPWPYLLIAALCVAVGILIGILIPSGQVYDPQQAVNHHALLESVNVSDVVVTPVIGEDAFEIAVLPSTLPEGMEITLFWEDLHCHSQPQSISCTFDGTYYRCQLPRDNKFQYRIIAVASLGGFQKQFPLVFVDGDHQFISYTCLWD